MARSAPVYRCSPLAEAASAWMGLDAPHRDKLMRNAEALHDQLEDDAAYPFAFVAFRLTGFRRDYGDDSLLVGQALRPDLRTLIDRVSKTLALPVGDGDAVTGDVLAAKLNVSTKTLSRWRKAGLRWRWVVQIPGARPVIGFTAEAVQQFRERQSGRVEKATHFSQLSAAQRQRIVDRARRLAATTDATFNQVAAHLAKRTGRALETIRLILEKHDSAQVSEGAKLFADRTGPLTPRQKRLISRAQRMGVGVGKLAERFRRSRATIHRVVLDRRAARALRLPLSAVMHANFARADAAEVYLRANLEPLPRRRDASGAHLSGNGNGNGNGDGPLFSSVPLDGLPAELRPLYTQPVVSGDKIRSLFLRYNFLKHRALTTRDTFAHAPARARDLDRFEHDIARAARVRSLLVTWHLPGVLSVARRHLVGKPENTTTGLMQLLELGNPVLIDAVDAYDAAARPTFDSVLTNRLLKAFATPPAPGNQRRPPGGKDDSLESRGHFDTADPAHVAKGKARRRVTPAEVMKRMIDLADESGIHLAISDPPPPETCP